MIIPISVFYHVINYIIVISVEFNLISFIHSFERRALVNIGLPQKGELAINRAWLTGWRVRVQVFCCSFLSRLVRQPQEE